MGKKNQKAENEYNGMMTLQQFRNTFPELGLSNEGYKELYEHLSDREAEEAVLYMATSDRSHYIFSAWDSPLSRGAYPSKLPPEVRITGDAGQLRTWLDQNEKNLNAADMAFVLNHIEVINKSTRLAEKADQDLADGKARPEKPALITDDKGYLRLQMPTPRAQSSSQGCWSAVMQMIVESRGNKEVSQEDIRSYRPEQYKMQDIRNDYMNPPFPDLDETYNKDAGKVAHEMMDAILKLSPNTMVRSMNIGRYNPSHPVITGKGITEQEYYANAKELMRQTIEKAIIIDHSPVMIKEPGHFLSVVGIQGDKLLIQDSRQLNGMGEDRLREISLDYFVEKTLKRDYEGLQLFWGSDIMLDQEGKIIGLPDEQTAVNEQGQVQPNATQIENGLFGASLTEGWSIKRFGGKTEPAKGQESITEDGLFRTDMVYLPKKLNLRGLKKEAELRTREQDEWLKSTAGLYYEEMQKLKGVSIQETLDQGLQEAQRKAAERETQKALERQHEEELRAQQEEQRRLEEENARRRLAELTEEERLSAKREKENDLNRASGYVHDLMEYKHDALDLLEDLRRIGVDEKTDPREYTDLIRALENVGKLSTKNTPDEIGKAVDALSLASRRCESYYRDQRQDDEVLDAKDTMRDENISRYAGTSRERRETSLYGQILRGTDLIHTPLEELVQTASVELDSLQTPEERVELSTEADQQADKLDQFVRKMRDEKKAFEGFKKFFGSDSEQYTRMLGALDKVCGLTRENNMVEVYEAIQELDIMTQEYQAKIDLEDGGKRSTGKKRYEHATELLTAIEDSGLYNGDMDYGFDLTRSLRDLSEAAAEKKMKDAGFYTATDKDVHEAKRSVSEMNAKQQETDRLQKESKKKNTKKTSDSSESTKAERKVRLSVAAMGDFDGLMECLKEFNGLEPYREQIYALDARMNAVYDKVNTSKAVMKAQTVVTGSEMKVSQLLPEYADPMIEGHEQSLHLVKNIRANKKLMQQEPFLDAYLNYYELNEERALSNRADAYSSFGDMSSQMAAQFVKIFERIPDDGTVRKTPAMAKIADYLNAYTDLYRLEWTQNDPAKSDAQKLYPEVYQQKLAEKTEKLRKTAEQCALITEKEFEDLYKKMGDESQFPSFKSYTLEDPKANPTAVVKTIETRQRLLASGVTPEEATLLVDFAHQVKSVLGDRAGSGKSMKKMLEPFKTMTADLKELADSCQEKFEKGFASTEEKNAFFRKLGERAADYMNKTSPELLPPADPQDEAQQNARRVTEDMLVTMRKFGLLDFGAFSRAIEIGNRQKAVQKESVSVQNENGKQQPGNSADQKNIVTDKPQPTLVSSSTDQMSFAAEKEQQKPKSDEPPKREKKGYTVLTAESRDSLSFVAKAPEKKEEPKKNAPKKGYQDLSFQSTDTISYVAPNAENNVQKRRLTYADVVNKEQAKEGTDKKNNAAGKKAQENRIRQERERLEKEKKESENGIKRSKTMK